MHDDVFSVPIVLEGGASRPCYARPGDAGADLCARVGLVLAPGERALVPTGVRLALPEGYAAFVHPRSGLAIRCGLSIVNTPGTIDSGYRGEIQVPLINTDRNAPISIVSGDRIAQLVIQPVVRAQFVVVEALPESERGELGFGSSGISGPSVSIGGRSSRGEGSSHEGGHDDFSAT